MSNPTTPFSWQMPTSTDLVTDLPADFEVFGQAVATSMADLLGGASGYILSKASATDMDFTWIANDQGDITGVTAGTGISGGGTSGTVTVTNSMATAITTNGDIIYGTGSGTFSRLGIGSSAQVLTVASGVPSWATPSSGGMTLIGTSTTLSGNTTVSITGIPATYNDLVIDIFATTQTSNTDYSINPNGSATITDNIRGGTTLQQLNDGALRMLNNIAGPLASSTNNSFRLIITNYAATSVGGKPFDFYGGFIGSDSSAQVVHNRGRIKTSSAITSLDFVSGVNWTAGTVEIYGVK